MDQPKRLSNLDDWKLVHEDQDIRGWTARNQDGYTLGTVDDLLVNTDTEMVEAIELENGQRYDVSQVELLEGVVLVLTLSGGGDKDPLPTAGAYGKRT
jgi:hypothetical protein